jgi:hypothetical protein
VLKKKMGLAIINRGFWPESQVIGETLLQLAERVSETSSVCVITQSKGNLRESLDSYHRGQNLALMTCRSRSDSSTGYLMRSLDALIFMAWTFFSLIRSRPEKIYVATNPPVAVPFIVFFYSRIFGAKYYYHLQDIHPEASNIVVRLNPLMFKLLKALDRLTMRHAEALITLSEDMKRSIEARSVGKVPILLLDNPAVDAAPSEAEKDDEGLVFCGNAGRLQRIPMLLESIRSYLVQGGKLHFTFMGAGIYSDHIKTLSDAFDAVTYHGFVAAPRAAEIIRRHRWALLPIEDEVTRYAFPSKSASYVLAGCSILAICGKKTSVARWVAEHDLGVVCEPEVDHVLQCLKAIERGQLRTATADRQAFLETLSIGHHVDKVREIMML